MSDVTPISPIRNLSRRAFWQRHIEQWQQAETAKRAYCRQHQLHYHQFMYWHKRLTCVDQPPVSAGRGDPSNGFVALSVSPSPAIVAPGLSLALPSGATIRGIDQHTVALVGQLLSQL